MADNLPYDRFAFEPLRIRAWLQSGIISDQFLPLDSVIYGQYVREQMGDRNFTVPGASMVPESFSIQLPFRKSNHKDRNWFYKCSFAQWPEKTYEDHQSYSKRFDLDQSDVIDFAGKRGLVATQSGQYKNYHVKVYYRHALYVDWYADGERKELERILKFCTHLGKKCSQGWGAVLRWEVIQWPEDWSIRGIGGRLMRNVPVNGPGVLYGVRPSYWLPKHQFTCKMPD